MINFWFKLLGHFGFLCICVIFLIEGMFEIYTHPILGFAAEMTILFNIITTAFFQGSRNYWTKWLAILLPWATIAYLLIHKNAPGIELPLLFIIGPLAAGVLLYLGISKPDFIRD